MASTVTPLFRPAPDVESPLDRVRDLAAELHPGEGNTSHTAPDVCLYRFSQPTTVTKAATFGVTLGVVLQGTKEVRFGPHAITVDPRRVIVVTRDTAHVSVAMRASSDEPFLGMSLLFRPEQVARALLAVCDAGCQPAPRETVPAFVMACDDPLAGALERLLLTLRDPVERKVLAPLVVDEILFRLVRSDAAAAIRGGVTRAPDAQRILESMSFIRANLADKLTVFDLARRAAMSPSHYAHRFTAVARTTPMRFLREVRLERARSLLLQGRARAGEIALDVGFESQAHFTREFKRRFGVPPTRYARATKE